MTDRGHMGQIFGLQLAVQKYMNARKKIYDTFADLGKAYIGL